jgi:hypothetical protein
MKNQNPRKVFGPGVWIDDDGGMHFSVPDLLKHFGWPDDAEHRALVEQGIKNAAMKRGDIPVIQPNCPHCGVSGTGPHRPLCPLAT